MSEIPLSGIWRCGNGDGPVAPPSPGARFPPAERHPEALQAGEEAFQHVAAQAVAVVEEVLQRLLHLELGELGRLVLLHREGPVRRAPVRRGFVHLAARRQAATKSWGMSA